MLFITTAKAQMKLARNVRLRRLSRDLTQAGLAERSGVPLPTLRKFEQKGLISLESFLKLLMVLGAANDDPALSARDKSRLALRRCGAACRPSGHA